ncbi:MAG TPA: hypothetical protein VGE29_06025 [Prosthecobacter sp.]
MTEPHALSADLNGSPSWLQLGQDGETESMLLGNAQALKSLRKAIDQAFEEGEGTIEVAESDLTAIRCMDVTPEWVTGTSAFSHWNAYGCLGAIVGVLMLAGLGFWTLLRPLVSAF